MSLYKYHLTSVDSIRDTLNVINKSTGETREEVHKISTWLLAHPQGFSTDVAPSPPPVDKSQYQYWEQAQWQAACDKAKAGEITLDSPLITLYMEEENGGAVGESTKAALRSDLFSYWNGVFRSGEVLTNFTLLDLDRKRHFRKTFEDEYCWLRLCEAHWKVDQLWINYFASWHKTHGPPGPIPNPNLKMRIASSPIDISSSPTPPASDVPASDDAVAGSKRAREESESPGAVRKRLKEIREKAFAPTAFHCSRPIPRKKATKLPKVSEVQTFIY